MKKLLVITLVMFGGLLMQPTFAKSVNPASSKQVSMQKVNINKAGAKEIAQVLSGIGSKKAEAIVAYRSKHGIFKTLADLAAVKGIGVRTLERNHDRIIL